MLGFEDQFDQTGESVLNRRWMSLGVVALVALAASCGDGGPVAPDLPPFPSVTLPTPGAGVSPTATLVSPAATVGPTGGISATATSTGGENSSTTVAQPTHPPAPRERAGGVGGLLDYLDQALDPADRARAEEAIEALDEQIQSDPLDGLAFFGRGVTYTQLREFDRALSDYNQAARLMPYFPDTYVARAVALLALGDSVAAMNDLALAAELGYSPAPLLEAFRGMIYPR